MNKNEISLANLVHFALNSDAYMDLVEKAVVSFGDYNLVKDHLRLNLKELRDIMLDIMSLSEDILISDAHNTAEFWMGVNDQKVVERDYVQPILKLHRDLNAMKNGGETDG